MDLDKCIAAHAQWKMKFRGAIASKGTMDAASIGADHCCELGKWLHGEGRSMHGGKPQFVALIDKHKAFHVEAGKVARLINARQYDAAEQAIANGTPYAAVSGTVGVAVIALKQAIASKLAA